MAALWKRRGFRILAAGLILLLVLIVALRLLVPADKVRDLLVAQIKDQTGIDVAFGEARVAVFPRLKVVVADGSFSGTGSDLTGTQTPGESAESPIESFRGSLDQLEVDLAIWPLLRKRIEMGKIRLVRPELTVVNRPTASESPSDPAGGGGVGKTAPTTEPAAEPTALTWEFALAGLEFQDGTLIWQEAGTDKLLTLRGWDQEVTAPEMSLLIERLNAFNYGLTPPPETRVAALNLTSRIQSLALSGFTEGNPVELNGLNLRGSLELPPAADRMQITVTELGWAQVRLSAELEVTSAGPQGSGLQGSWRSEPIDLPALVEELKTMVPPAEGELAAWLKVDPLRAGQVSVTGRVDLPWPVPASLAPSELWTGLPLNGSVAALRTILPRQLGELSGDCAFSLDGKGWRVTGIDLQAGDGALTLQGNISSTWPGATGGLQADLKPALDLAFVTKVLVAFPPTEVADASAFTFRPAGKVQGQITLNLPDPALLGDAQTLRTNLTEGRLRGVSIAAQGTDLSLADFTPGEPWRAREFSFTSDLRTATFALSEVQHPHLQGSLNGRAARVFPVPELEVDLAVTQVDVDRLVALWQPETTTAWLVPPRTMLDHLLQELIGVAWALTPTREDTRPLGEILPTALTIAYQGQAERVLLQNARYDRVELAGRLADKVARFDSVTAYRSGGQIQGTGSIDYNADPHGQLAFTAHATDVPAAALLEPYVPGVAPLWEGKVSAQLTGGCNLKDKRTVLSTLSLLGGARSTNGHIDARALLEDVSPYLGSRQDLKMIRFREFLQDIDINNGRYHLNSLLLTGPDTDWQGDGWLGFDGSLDLNLQVKLPADFTPKLGDLSFLAENMRGDDGRIQLAFRLSGEVTRPAVQLDLTQAKEATREQVEDTVRDRVQGLLDKWKRK